MSSPDVYRRRSHGAVQCWLDGRVQEGRLTLTTEERGVLMHRAAPTLLVDGEERLRSECEWLRIATDPCDLRIGDYVSVDHVDALLVEVRVNGLGGSWAVDDDGLRHSFPGHRNVWRYDDVPPRAKPAADGDPFAGLPGV